MILKRSYLAALAISFLSICSLPAQNLSNPILWESECTECGTLGLQVNTNYDGECGVHFSYSGLIGCPFYTATWKVRTQFGQVIASYPDDPQGIFHQFISPGTYVIELRIEMHNGRKGCIETVSTPVTIPAGACGPLECDQACAPNHEGAFNVLASSLCLASAVVSETSLYPCNITNYNFNWGDGFADNTTNSGAIHQYATDGVYDVCVTITSTNGVDVCETRLCRTIEISNCGPYKRSDLPTVSAFPNPVEAGSILHLDLGDQTVSYNLELWDVNGKKVAEWEEKGSGYRIPANLVPGSYILRGPNLNPSAIKIMVR